MHPPSETLKYLLRATDGEGKASPNPVASAGVRVRGDGVFAGSRRVGASAVSEVCRRNGSALPRDEWRDECAMSGATTPVGGSRLWSRNGYGHTFNTMAIPKIKATYSLDEDTVEMLERLARRWNTSKSDALRRVIRQSAASAAETPEDQPPALLAFQRAQRAAGLTESSANVWTHEVRASRHASFPRTK